MSDREMHPIYFCTLDVLLSWGFRADIEHGLLSAPSTRAGVNFSGK